MDPFSAFAAAGNVIQFVQIGISIATKTVELVGNGGDVPIQDLKILAQQIIVSNDHLRQALEKDETRNRPPGPESALQHANETCLRTSEDFLKFLTSITATGSVNMWKAIVTSFKQSRVQEKLSDYHRKLSDARSNLILSLLLVHHTRSSGSDQHHHLATSTQDCLSKLIQSLPAQHQSLKSDVVKLAELLEKARISDRARDAQHEMLVLARHCRELGGLYQTYESSLEPLQNSISELQNLLLSITKNLDSSTQRNDRIFSSLRFLEMSNRRETIASAHNGTYTWMLEFDKTADVVWDNFMQWLMLKGTSNVFWVRGRPGAGKSTLMRWIDQKIEQRVKHELQSPQQRIGLGWLKPDDMSIVSYYFWHAGSIIQKSVKGFLQSVLFQIFRADASLIQKCMTEKLWEQIQLGTDGNVMAWQEKDLKDLILSVLSEMRTRARVLFIIDGLDEFDGSDDQRGDMVSMIKKWTGLPHVKACLSSRPWNVYSDLFESTPQLRLENLTRQDMSIFTRDQLQGDSLFQRCQRTQPQTAKTIMQEIVDKSNGVFLWVRLVIVVLLKDLRNGTQFKDLITELRKMPDDLEDFFMRMMNSIEPRYRPEAARLLQVMLFNANNSIVDSKDSRYLKLIDHPNLLLYDTLHLHKQEAAFFCLEPGRSESLQNFEANEPQEEHDVYDMVVRRINSRSMGLLEVLPLPELNGGLGMCVNKGTLYFGGTRFKKGAILKLFAAKVDFVHRTVNEFLLTHTAQSFLNQFTNNKPYAAHAYCYNALIARFLATYQIPETDFTPFLRRLLCHLKLNPQYEEQNLDLFEIVMFSDVAQKALANGRLACEFAAQTENSTLGQSLAFIYAYELGWCSYVMSRMRAEHVNNAFKVSFVELALGSRFVHHIFDSESYFRTAKYVIQLGSKTLPQVAKSRILLEYLSLLPQTPNVKSKEAVEIVCFLLESGAERYFTVSDLRSSVVLWRYISCVFEPLETATYLCDIVDVLHAMAGVFYIDDIRELKHKLSDSSQETNHNRSAAYKARVKEIKRKLVEDDAGSGTPLTKRYHIAGGTSRSFIDLTGRDETESGKLLRKSHHYPEGVDRIFIDLTGEED